ncbi:unnamed protein product [Bemisia tabaci]|uniref:Protein misato n=1 Tax=Bemisia tabaci TaxID=7038 RepID=A0A9P0A222_BEMTA|nr:unnamed protein product [Bemisia tabaci]
MSSGREVITLQFGHQSNFVGAHWWNIQESGFIYDPTSPPSEINHDVLYREGINHRNEVTFTPRAIVVDLHGSLNHLKTSGELYDDPGVPSPETIPWQEDKIEVVTTDQPVKNEFLQNLEKEDGEGVPENGKMIFELDNDINVWSDYLKTRFHPRTLSIVNEYKHNDNNRPFESYIQGSEVWNSPNFGEDWCDKCRLFVEESDNLQGFQILMDSTNGFSGLAGEALQYLNDEYNSKSVLTFPVLMSTSSSHSTDEESMRIVNLVMAFAKSSEFSSLVVPMSCHNTTWRQYGPGRNFQHLNYDVNFSYHTSAILASYLETISLYYRRRSDAYRMLNLCSSVTPTGRKMANAVLSLPFALGENGNLLRTLELWEGPLWSSLTPHCEVDESVALQSIAVRGIQKHQLVPTILRPQDQCNPLFNHTTSAGMLDAYLTFSCDGVSSQVISIEENISTTAPYPNIFSEHIQRDGSFSSNPRPSFMAVEKSSSIAGLQSAKSTGDMLSSLHSEASRLNLRRILKSATSDLEVEDYSEAKETLLCLSECYSDNMFI